jgi:isopenicillin-N epimerase
MPKPNLARHWLLDPDVTYLNHGSFGACPRPVLELQTELRERLEREPVRFLDDELEGRLDAARAALAAFIGAQPLDLVFLPNATTGVNTVLHSLELRPGDEILTTDHEYNACLNAVKATAAAAGATVVVARLPYPVGSPDEIVAAISAAATPRTRLALYSHVTSPTALVLPIERIAASLAERGIESLVDGAHAPGMVAIDLERLARVGVAWYTGNCHKWLCAPKGAGFLWVRADRQASIKPLVVSHAANSARTDRSYFVQAADWTGTIDPTPYLCVPAALDFVGSLLPTGWPGLMAANHRLVQAARSLLLRTLGPRPLAPEEMLGAMATVELPAGIEPPPPAIEAGTPAGTTYGADRLHDVLFERHHIEVPVFLWPPVAQADRPTLRLLRISAQVYNSLADYERLAQALRDLAGAPAGGD